MPERLALVTYAGQPDLSADDRLLLPALADQGIRGVPVMWDDPDVSWGQFDAVIIRSTWDYHRRPAAFLAWIDRLAVVNGLLWNPPHRLRWNVRKTYLADLQSRGVRIVPFRLVPRASQVKLSTLLEELGWDEAVVKPAVSASGEGTWRTSRRQAEQHEATFRSFVDGSPMLVQPFVPEILVDGEWSLIFLDGAFSHAVVKRPRAGEFRVHAHLGGTVERAEPPAHILAAARQAVREAAPDCLYVRVDGCLHAGHFHIIEVELIEPALYLGYSSQAPVRFAAAVRGILPRSRRPMRGRRT